MSALAGFMQQDCRLYLEVTPQLFLALMLAAMAGRMKGRAARKVICVILLEVETIKIAGMWRCTTLKDLDGISAADREYSPNIRPLFYTQIQCFMERCPSNGKG